MKKYILVLSTFFFSFSFYLNAQEYNNSKNIEYCQYRTTLKSIEFYKTNYDIGSISLPNQQRLAEDLMKHFKEVYLISFDKELNINIHHISDITSSDIEEFLKTIDYINYKGLNYMITEEKPF